MQPILILDERTAVKRNHQGNKCYHYCQNTVQRIKSKFNTDWRFPATHPVMPGFAAGFQHSLQYDAGIGKGTGDRSHNYPGT